MTNLHRRWFTLGACSALLLAGCSSSGGGSPASADLQLPVAFGLVRDQAGLAQQVEDSLGLSRAMAMAKVKVKAIPGKLHFPAVT